MKICLLDPGLENHHGEPSANLGDLIIQDAVKRELLALFEGEEMVQFSTHAPLEKADLAAIRSCSLIFVGGSNLLSSYMDKYKQWDVSLWDAINIRKAVLLGAGWWKYQGDLNRYTKALLKLALSSKYVHSVRDGYTQEKLQDIKLKDFSIGMKNVLNTGCPTMWPLMDLKPHEVSEQKAKNVLLMLTDYRQAPELDRKLLKIVSEAYENVYFWWQGRGDKDYVQSLGYPVTIIDHSLSALDDFIASEASFDYIGTRLHGGIRCLCAKKRSLIIEIDNRAREISQDTHLQTVVRDDFDYIRHWIAGSSQPQIVLNADAIATWKNQFKPLMTH